MFQIRRPFGSFLNFFKKKLCMWMCGLHLYMCITCMHAWCLKRVSDLLKLEFQTAVSHHVGDGNRTRLSAKAASTLHNWTSSLGLWCFDRKQSKQVFFVVTRSTSDLLCLLNKVESYKIACLEARGYTTVCIVPTLSPTSLAVLKSHHMRSFRASPHRTRLI